MQASSRKPLNVSALLVEKKAGSRGTREGGVPQEGDPDGF